MGEPITVTGVILSSQPQGEYDRRIMLLTKERGKISAFARGARKSTSPLLAVSNAFVFGTFTMYEGRTSYTLVQASVKQYFTELAKAQPEVYYGFYFLEFADYFSREGIDGTDMINLLYLTMKALLHRQPDNDLIRSIFELKAMVINGEYPQVFECMNCGKKDELTMFSVEKSGIYCGDCIKSCINGIPISPAALYTLQYIIASGVEKLYTFTVTDEVKYEIQSILKRYIARYIDKKFKTLEILEMMC